jgi:predicted metal-dependent phosphoesterase TrpH
MHLHTSHSGWRRLHMIDAQDSYLTPEAAFAAARRRGMDFVCFTDHDTLDGARAFLDRHPEEEPRVIVGEEREVLLPGTRQWLHLGVYGLDETDHRELARRRCDAYDAIAYLTERRLLFTLNHPFQSFRSIDAARRHLEPLLRAVPAVEALNSSSPPSHRRAIESWLARLPGAPAAVAGSDAHTMSRIAAAYTLAPGRTKEDFLLSIRAGRCAVGGEALGLPSLLRDAYRVIGQYYRSVYAPGASLPRRRDRRNILGSLLLAPCVLLGLPAILTSLHVLRQEWIARIGRWDEVPAGSEPVAERAAGAAGGAPGPDDASPYGSLSESGAELP